MVHVVDFYTALGQLFIGQMSIKKSASREYGRFLVQFILETDARTKEPTMLQIQQQSGERLEILAAIRRGMPVYDSEEIKRGIATRIYWGADTNNPDSDEFQVTFLGVKSLPPEAATLIREQGCIRVDSGLVNGNFYVLPSQVSFITEEGMFLSVRGDELMMF